MTTEKKLTLLELLNLANEAYPDGFLAEYYDTKTGKRQPGSGDSLARFIVAELSETFNPDVPQATQLGEARIALGRAIGDLASVIAALS